MGSRQRWWRAGVLALAVVAMGALAQGVAGAGTTKTKTVVVYPWTSAGKLKAIKVAGTVKGTCWTSSIAVSSSDAYRCMSKSVIYDPCFAPPTKAYSELACMADPWGAVIRFALTAPIPKAAMHPNSKPWVWAYQLGNGVRCITDTGTGTIVAKVVLNYYCVPGKGWASIPDERAEPWTARYAKSYQAKATVPEKLTTAWY